MTAHSVVASGTDFLGYRVEEPIGRAGEFVVHRAEDVRLKRRVALALSPEGLGHDDAFRERFLRDVEVAASLEHPNVVPVYDAGDEEGRLYLAMRYVDGVDLAERLGGEELSLERTLEIGAQVAAALDAAHARGLVHGHLTAASILLASTGHPYLTGLGLGAEAGVDAAEDVAAFAQILGLAAPGSPLPVDGTATCAEVVAALRSRKTRRRLRRSATVVAVAVGIAVATAFLPDDPAPSDRLAPEITQAGILGAAPGQTAGQYEKRFGEWLANPLPAMDYRGMHFLDADVGVYFPPGRQTATVVTTWNRRYRTAEGIGPCSTVAAMHRAYGNAVRPAWAGTQLHAGVRTVYSWVVGDNLLFATDDWPYIRTVAVYRGDPDHTRAGSPQAYANWVGLDEAGCVPGG